MKKLEKEKSAALRNKDFDKASEIQSQIDEFEEKAQSSRPKRWQYEGKSQISMTLVVEHQYWVYKILPLSDQV